MIKNIKGNESWKGLVMGWFHFDFVLDFQVVCCIILLHGLNLPHVCVFDLNNLSIFNRVRRFANLHNYDHHYHNKDDSHRDWNTENEGKVRISIFSCCESTCWIGRTDKGKGAKLCAVNVVCTAENSIGITRRGVDSNVSSNIDWSWSDSVEDDKVWVADIRLSH